MSALFHRPAFRRGCGLLSLPVIAILAASCNLQVTRTPYSDTTCTLEQLVAPSPTSPAQDAVVGSHTPSLTWDFSANCYPLAYRIYLSTSSYFWDVGLDKVVMDARSWTVETALSEGQDYYWKVAAMAMNPATLQLKSGPYSEVRHFNTGQRCDAAGMEASIPELVYPSFREIIYTQTPILDWRNRSGCLEDYRVEISGYDDFANSWIFFVSQRTELDTAVHPGRGKLNKCMWYYWRVKVDRDPTYSRRSEFYISTTGALCPTPLGVLDFHRTIPPEPIDIPPGLTLTPTALTATANEDANCRSGPFVTSDAVGIFRKGATASVTARDVYGTWFQINLPNTAVLCWVWEELVTFSGDPQSAPVLEVATPTPTSCPVTAQC